MKDIIIFISYSFFKNLSSIKNSGYLNKGYAIVSVILNCHLLVILKLITKVESFESVGINKSTILIVFIIFSICLALIFSFFTSKKYLNKCVFKYKKNKLLNNTGGIIFILYFLTNLYVSSNILVNEISEYSYLKFIILPLSFYIYCKIINSSIRESENISASIDAIGNNK
jgi:hypothetical protein